MYILQLLLQLLLLFGSIVVLGLLVHYGEKLFYIIMPSSRGVYLATGLIGTPVHELSHALMCVIFGHRIVAIRLYTPNSQDGSLGSVEHLYNPRNLYQLVGNYFIGIAPIVVGSAVLILLTAVNSPLYIEHLLQIFAQDTITFDSAWQWLIDALDIIFVQAQYSSWMWWVCMVVSLQIALHMGLSGADISNSKEGALLLMAIYVAVAMIASIFVEIATITTFAMQIAVIVISSGMLALIMIAFMILLALLVSLVRTMATRR